MRHATISAHHVRHHIVPAAVWIIAAFWIVAGAVAVIALGGGLTRLAVALAIVTTEWWLISEVEDRFERNAAGSDAEMAPVIHLLPAPTDQRELKKTPAHASWRGPTAAGSSQLRAPHYHPRRGGSA
jgi:hypothetical protein